MNKLAPLQEKTTQRDFSEIELTEEDLRRAREDKFYRMEKEKYWAGVLTEPEVITYTAKELMGRLKASKNPAGKSFIVDKDNQAQVEIICQYFAGVTAPDIDPAKGLALLGNVGVGKTYLMAFFFQNQVQSYAMANCRKIEGQWVEEASQKEKPPQGVISRYSGPIQGALNGNPFGHTQIGVCFDDLGTETSPSKAYGEEKNVLAEILMNRYESGMPFNMTHVTTNLSAHDIGIKYGTRVRDRFREMFNMITFPNEAKSRRS